MSNPASTAGGSTQTPAIRTFQMDGSSQGAMASSVNLFRGDVNLSRTLFTLPGRAPDGVLDVSLTIQYQSNVFRQAATWNADAPTGILGLGWDMPLTWIEAADDGSPAAAARRYVLYDNGSPSAMFEQPVAAPLFEVPTAPAPLRDGDAVPADMRAAFLGHGLALSAQARVTGSGPWTIDDDELQQQFRIEAHAGGWSAADGGRSYQLQNYRFWKILYYPRYERWLIVDQQGMRRSFGGRGPDTDTGFATSTGNSVAWSVWWTNGGSLFAWTGASGETANQVQVARAWYLAGMQDRFGSTVSFGYNGGSRDGTGVVPVVEQQVGPGGKPYTKAMYLTRIVDSFGRTVIFTYGDKLWDAAPAAAREYHDPHRAVPAHAPGPYQDRYETRYLAGVAVNGPGGTCLFRIGFVYEPVPGSPVASVTGATGTLHGDTCKRFLTGVVQYDQDGVASPGFLFAYDLAPDTAGGQPGALRAVTCPQGGTTRYTYSGDQHLVLADRSARADRPAGVPDGAAPRVFFGPDYAVVCFYNQNSLQLSLQVYTWTGSWLQWQPSPDSAVIDGLGLSLDTLDVQASTDFMTLRFSRTGGELAVYVFERNVAQPGQWCAATLDGTATAPNRPTLVYDAADATPRLHAGNTFFVVARMSNATLRGSYDVVTWRWSTRTWTRTTVQVPAYAWLAARAEYFAVLGADGTLQLNYLDGLLQWRAAAPVRIEGLATDVLESVALTPGAGLLVVTNRLAWNAQQNTYRHWIAEWDAAYTIAVGSHGPYTDWFGSGNAPSGWLPVVMADTLIGTNGNLLRRDGKGWRENTALNQGVAPAGAMQRFAHGAGHVIRVTAPTTGVGDAQAVVLSFDPTRTDPWSAPTALAQALPAQATQARNWPSSAGEDWAMIGPYLYHRGTATDWGTVVGADPVADLDAVVAATGAGNGYRSDSLVDAAPAFLAYTVEDGATQSVQALILANGALAGTPVPFAAEKLLDPSLVGVGGAGVAGRGPGMFVSFPAHCSGFDDAQSVFLHRYAGDAVAGPLRHYTVVGVEMDDGFGDPIRTSFMPDPATAGADASGNIVKYYRNTVFPGTADPGVASNGHVVNRYLNGVADRVGDNFYDMLDGLLTGTETYAAGGELVASSRTTWKVIEQVASRPDDPAAAPVQLRGGWVVATLQEDMSDGVTATTATAYARAGLALSYCGQPVSITRTNVSGNGEPESFTTVTRYGAEVTGYGALVAIHALADVAQVSGWRTGADGVPVATASSATTYSGWPSRAGDGVLTPAPEARLGLRENASVDFPFPGYRPGSVPDGWQLGARITARTPYGQEAGDIDALGNSTTFIFDANDELAIAHIANADARGCAYLGFQPYESAAGWTLADARYDDDDAWSGVRSAVLPAGAGASVGTAIEPAAAGTQLVGCRYRTPAGFRPDGSGLTATVTAADGTAHTCTLPWADTGGRWTYATLPVPVADGRAAGTAVAVLAVNTSAWDVHIASVLVTPLVTAATVRTFDPDSQLILSTMDAGGRTSRTYYDRGHRPCISVGSAGLVREISTSFLSRQASRDGGFAAASPNAELTLHAAGGGTLETFRDGGAWRTRWTPSGPDTWQAADGALTQRGTEPATLTWSEQPADTFAVYMELHAGAGAQAGMRVGDITVRSSGTGWTAGQGDRSWAAQADRAAGATRWLLVVGDGIVLFFGDGQLLFSERTAPAGREVAVTAGGGATLRHLTGVTGVRLGLAYNDAGGRQRQVHQLHGADSLVCALVFDALDRQVATTKSAPGSFGSGAAMPPLRYRPGFLDTPAFLAALDSDWTMRGDVADYYAGQADDGIARSDDEGYPYWGKRYEPSPRAVRIETGLPGKAYAIDLTVPAERRRTTQFRYGAGGGDGTGLPAGQYHRTQVTSAVKTLSTQINDLLGQQVATVFADEHGTPLNRSAGARAYAASPQGPTASIVQQLPNALVPGPQSGMGDYVRVTLVDAQQMTRSVIAPDSGETRFVFDAAGHLRFVRPAMDAGEAWFIYYRYDAIGRMLEEGTVQGDWDDDALRARTDDAGWPAAGSDGATAKIVIAYDGAGGDPSLVGMKWTTTTHNAAPDSLPGSGAITVVETMGYDTAGNLIAVTQEVAGAVTARGELGYTYDQMGDVLCLTLPAGAPLERIYYGYDDQGNVVAVGTSPGGTELGRFRYGADNEPVEQASGSWLRSAVYDPAGRPVGLTAASTDGGTQRLEFSLAYDADDAMTKRDVRFAFAGFNATYDDSFTYDAQRRLVAADGASDVRYGPYDPNGNLWGKTCGDEHTAFGCAAGRNRLASVQVDNGAPEPLRYNARGQMIAGLGRTLSYDATTGMTMAVQNAGQALRLAYGGAQQRVVRQVVGGATRVDFAGAGQVPVASLVDGAWAVTVRGPMGLLAWVSDRTYWLLADTTQSVWGVVADDELVGARTYRPFGEMRQAYGKDPVPYAFQGQGWDPEVALYDFRARFYDPALARFLAPDPRRQFASGYVFANNSPLIITDPTGEISVWAQVGVAAAMVTIFAVGLGLTLFTGGASDAAAATANGALLGATGAAEGTAAAAEGGVVAGATAGAADAGAGAAVAGAEGTAAAGAGASAEVTAGVGTAQAGASSSAFSWSSVAGSTLMSGGYNGLTYDLAHGRDFTACGLLEAAGIGAATAFVGGVASGGLGVASGMLTEGMSGASGLAARTAAGAVNGMISGALKADVKTILTNMAQHQPWYQGLLRSTLSAAGQGALGGAGKTLGKAAWASTRATISNTTMEKVTSITGKIKSAAKSDTMVAGYIVAGFFLPAGYAVWGATTEFKG